jgi:hypothetical protein
MGGVALRALAAAIAVALAPACSVVATFGWPRQTVTEVVERPATVQVRSVPAGAQVSTGDGHVIGRSPVVYQTTSPARRTYRLRSYAGPIIGGVVGAVALVVGSAMTADHGIHWDSLERWNLVAAAGFVELCNAAILGLVAVPTANKRALTGATYELLPRSQPFTVEWPGWPAQSAAADLRLEHHLTVRRRSFGTIDEALVRWARGGPRAPKPAGLYRIGLALADLAGKTGRSEDAREAVSWLERFLASDDADPQRRAEAQARIDRLRARLPAERPQ